jgi:hypothetical protein
MNFRISGALGFAAAALILTAPLAAHHSSVFYDLRNPITLKGEIQQVEWMNPHVYLYLDVRGSNGKVENWAVEMGSPNRITGVGWTKETLKIGTSIEVRGAPAKSRSPAGSALSAQHAESNHYVLGGCITLPNGEKRAPSYGPPCS